jgi:hypothetical protein
MDSQKVSNFAQTAISGRAKGALSPKSLYTAQPVTFCESIKLSACVFQFPEPISKRFSLAEVKAGENFNRRNTWRISRIEI